MPITLEPIKRYLQQIYIIKEYERGLLYENGKFIRLLEPGRYAFPRFKRIEVTTVSLRQMSEVVSGQDILSADRIEVRVSLIAQYSVTDPLLAINAVENYTEQLYQDLQLTLRDQVASRTVDELLQARAELAEALLNGVAPLALAYGVTLKRVGIRDIILPGTVRNIFLKEVTAEREGQADLIRARHEVAAARARANTARILSENPHVMRLKEIDALLELAGKHGNVILLPNIADLLTMRSTSGTPSVSTGNTPPASTEDEKPSDK